MKKILVIIVLLFFIDISLAYVKIGLSKKKNIFENEFEFDNLTSISPTLNNDTLLELGTTTVTTTTTTTEKSTESSIKSVINYTIPSVFRRSTKSPKVNTTTTTESPPANNENQLNNIRTSKSSNYYCDCDFQSDLCDVNCCCDIDCNNKILQTFNCQFDLGYRENNHFENGLQSCRMNEGWLCVFRRNVRVQKKDRYNPNLKVIDSFSWPSPNFFNSINNVFRRNFYKIGEPIIIYNQELNKLMEFEFPFSLINSYCHIVEPIRHLVPEKRNCLTNLEKSTSSFNTLQNMLFNSYLLRQPVNNGVEGFSEICSKLNNNCRQINVYRCGEDEKCNKIEKHLNDSLTLMDNDILHKMNVMIYHNFTSLMVANVYFYFKEIDYLNTEMPNEFWQQLIVEFIEINKTHLLNSKVGGPLGYHFGRPIVVTNYTGIKGKTYDKSNVADYLDTIKELPAEKTFKLMIPISENGYCKHSNSDEYSIKFGENLFINCFIKLDNNTIIDQKSNFVNICNNIQEIAFGMLLNNPNDTINGDLHISELGKPKNSSEFWQRIRLINFENIKISGFANLNENSFICQNMIISVKYKFFIEQVDFNKIPYQNVIKDVYIQFESRVDLQFQFSEEVKVPLSLSAMFYDLTDIPDSVQRFLSMNIYIYSLLIGFLNFFIY